VQSSLDNGDTYGLGSRMMILRLSVRYLVAFGHIFEIFRITSRLAGLGIGVIVGIARLWFFKAVRYYCQFCVSILIYRNGLRPKWVHIFTFIDDAPSRIVQ
jgi:hypothetical protein